LIDYLRNNVLSAEQRERFDSEDNYHAIVVEGKDKERSDIKDGKVRDHVKRLNF